MNWFIMPLLLFLGLPLLVHGRRGFRANPDNDMLRSAGRSLVNALTGIGELESEVDVDDTLWEQFDGVDFDRTKKELKHAIEMLDDYRKSKRDDMGGALKAAIAAAKRALKEMSYADVYDDSSLKSGIAGMESHQNISAKNDDELLSDLGYGDDYDPADWWKS